MASFQEALAKTELFEGGYSDNPLDSGGETYRGISRRNWPTWAGWAFIDNYKGNSPVIRAVLERDLDDDTVLQGLVVEFYRHNYWHYDGLHDQDVAWKVFDLGVNIGKAHAVKMLQALVGAVIDGVYGPHTEMLANLHPIGSLASLIRTIAEKYYQQIVVSHPEDAVFLHGWLRRVQA